MTNGELFIRENPTVETKINGSCVWIYFDGVNHYTMPTLWWEQEIGLFENIKAEIKFITDSNGVNHIHRDDVFKIIDKYRGADEIAEHYKKLGEYYNKGVSE